MEKDSCYNHVADQNSETCYQPLEKQKDCAKMLQRDSLQGSARNKQKLLFITKGMKHDLPYCKYFYCQAPRSMNVKEMLIQKCDFVPDISKRLALKSTSSSVRKFCLLSSVSSKRYEYKTILRMMQFIRRPITQVSHGV